MTLIKTIILIFKETHCYKQICYCWFAQYFFDNEAAVSDFSKKAQQVSYAVHMVWVLFEALHDSRLNFVDILWKGSKFAIEQFEYVHI